MNWGYSPGRPRAIDMDSNQFETAEKLQRIEPVLRSCIGCGNCTATCTAGNLTSFNVRRIQTLFRRGEYDGLLQEIGKCMLCGKCRMLCPRGINTRKVIINIQRILSE